MNKKAITLVLAIITLSGLSIYGWVMNIIKLVAIMDGEVSVELIIRCVGTLLAPLGIVMGYI